MRKVRSDKLSAEEFARRTKIRQTKTNLERRRNPMPDKYTFIANNLITQNELDRISKEMETI